MGGSAWLGGGSEGRRGPTTRMWRERPTVALGHGSDESGDSAVRMHAGGQGRRPVRWAPLVSGTRRQRQVAPALIKSNLKKSCSNLIQTKTVIRSF
jgi:hypothetical protein